MVLPLSTPPPIPFPVDPARSLRQVSAIPQMGAGLSMPSLPVPQIPVPDFGFGQQSPSFMQPLPPPALGVPDRPMPLIGGYSPDLREQAFSEFSQWGQAGQTGYGSLDAHNSEFNRAGSQWNAPANLLKAMVNRESSGNWSRDGARVAYLDQRDDYILPFVGITKRAADAWGLDFWGMVGNKQAQIDGMAKIVSGLSDQYGGFDNAIKVYFGGPDALDGVWYDENGLPSDYYYNEAKKMWTDFDARSPGKLPTINRNAFSGNWVVQEALKYEGTPYVWGGIPGKGDPGGNWDCSGMTYWLDQNYGDGSLPMGSHYQYQWAQQNNRLFMDTNQLKPGDLLFFDTGNRAGAGAELNNAGHVGIYIGNGQMLHAANPQAGTIVSNLNSYMQMYGFLGAATSSYSGGHAIGGNGRTGFGGYQPGQNWRSWVSQGFRQAA